MAYDRSGSKNPKWRGGRTESTKYWKVRAEGHPRAEIPGFYVLEHILIAERALGKFLPLGAVVHHRDGNSKNNDRSNLVICQSIGYHKLIHRRERIYRTGSARRHPVPPFVPCGIEGCPNRLAAKGLCRMHRRRAIQYGAPDAPTCSRHGLPWKTSKAGRRYCSGCRVDARNGRRMQKARVA